MDVIGFTETGGPEVLRLISREVPRPGRREVLIRVSFAGVNFAEVQHRRGEFGAPEGTEIPGLEVSGTIAELGAEVEGLHLGDEVAAYLPTFGGYAEYVVAPASFVYPTTGLDPRSVAGFPCVAPTAFGLVHSAGRIGPDDTVLIHAAAGGVGSAAAQLARLAGAAMVIGTVGSADKVEQAQRFDYDVVLVRDRFVEAVTELTRGRGVDVVLDPIGGFVRARSVDLLAPFGRLVAFGDASLSEDLSYAVRDLWKRNLAIGGLNVGDLARRNPSLLASHAHAALDLLRRGDLRLEVSSSYPLSQAAIAHQRLERGVTTGKTVLEVSA